MILNKAAIWHLVLLGESSTLARSAATKGEYDYKGHRSVLDSMNASQPVNETDNGGGGVGGDPCQCTVSPAQYQGSTTFAAQGVSVSSSFVITFYGGGTGMSRVESTSAGITCTGTSNFVGQEPIVDNDDCTVTFPGFTETSCSMQCNIDIPTPPCSLLIDGTASSPATGQFSDDCQCLQIDTPDTPTQGFSLCRTGVVVDPVDGEGPPPGMGGEEATEDDIYEWLENLAAELYGENEDIQDTLETLEGLDGPTTEMVQMLRASKDSEVQRILTDDVISSLVLADPLDPSSGKASPEVIQQRIDALLSETDPDVEVLPSTPQDCKELDACGIVVEDPSFLEALACSLPYIDAFCNPIRTLKEQERQRDEITKKMLEALEGDGDIEEFREQQRKLVEDGIPKIMGAAKELIIALADAIAAGAGGTLLKTKEQIEKNIKTAKKVETLTDGEFDEDDVELIEDIFDETVDSGVPEETKDDLDFLDSLISDITGSEIFEEVVGWFGGDDEENRRTLLSVPSSGLGGRKRRNLAQVWSLEWNAPPTGVQSIRYRFALGANRTRFTVATELQTSGDSDRCLSAFVLPVNNDGTEIARDPQEFYTLAAYSRESQQLRASDFASGRHLLPALLGQNSRSKLCFASDGGEAEELILHFAPLGGASALQASSSFELTLVAHNAGVPSKTVWEYISGTTGYIESLANPDTGGFAGDAELDIAVNDAQVIIEDYIGLPFDEIVKGANETVSSNQNDGDPSEGQPQDQQHEQEQSAAEGFGFSSYYVALFWLFVLVSWTRV